MLDVTRQIETSDAEQVLNEVQKIYYGLFKSGKKSKEIEFDRIRNTVKDIKALFNGEYSGYQKCDTKYHDLEHTLQATLAMARLLDGRNKSGDRPLVSARLFCDGIIATLLHDTGYIKKIGDNEGTGAKYTLQHIERSVDFADKYLSENKYDPKDTERIKNIIRCTGVKIDFTKINLKSLSERLVGFSLGSADLLSQMAAENYIEKLPILFREFEESYQYEGIEKLKNQGTKMYKDADELIKSTPAFYEFYVKKHLQEMGSVYRYLNYHFPNGRNLYIESIEKNMEKIKYEKNNSNCS